eukprot:CAMPEP_0172491090 /NCGR_PEP_ID=MMETSP1066-20121228/21781_1 /TAXON_ID=671091 /ORGANISM="Coscinodiscus wailesii, Strain CCMP2513" /LENGTH=135 /DNA_ID=CAMNT_0013259939 /DNA_START=203 /DNA_END=606 /DNA_ORIENTATION=+
MCIAPLTKRHAHENANKPITPATLSSRNAAHDRHCRLPYPESSAAAAASRYQNTTAAAVVTTMTPIETKRREMSRAQKNRELVSEYESFASRLEREREERLAMERRGAVCIQRFMRGMAVRRRRRRRRRLMVVAG